MELAARHREPGSIIEIVRIEPESSVRLDVYQVLSYQAGVFGLAVRSKTHKFILTGINLEAGVVCKSRIQ
jgi:hypothetical protein